MITRNDEAGITMHLKDLLSKSIARGLASARPFEREVGSAAADRVAGLVEQVGSVAIYAEAAALVGRARNALLRELTSEAP